MLTEIPTLQQEGTIDNHHWEIKMSKKSTTIGVITKLQQIKAPKGHQTAFCGTGTHLDRRTRRNRTKAAQKLRAIREYN